MSQFNSLIPFLQGDGPNMMTMFIIIAGVWIFLVILPGRKEKKRKQEMLESLKKGDQVLMQSGVIGKVHSIKNERIVLEFDGTKIPFLRSTVVRTIDPSGGDKTD